MATSMTYDLSYDAPLAAVAEMLMDPTYREQVCDAQGAVRKTVSFETGSSGDIEVLINEILTADGLPGFARKFVGDEINLIQTERWSDAGSATVEVDIPGKPGQISGTIRLRESGATTTKTIQLDIRVKIPLVAGKLESLLVEMFKKALREENAVGRTYLAG